jgi:hypothetical protein
MNGLVVVVVVVEVFISRDSSGGAVGTVSSSQVSSNIDCVLISTILFRQCVLLHGLSDRIIVAAIMIADKQWRSAQCRIVLVWFKSEFRTILYTSMVRLCPSVNEHQQQQQK